MNNNSSSTRLPIPQYVMTLAHAAALRSEDPYRKVGAAALDADNIEIHSGLSLIATVGNNMASRQGTAATIFSALADSHINIRMIDQGSSEMNIIVGVDTFDYEKAINAIYYAFC